MITKRIQQVFNRYRLARSFDEKAYYRENPDVEQDGMDALIHYVRFGIYEGRRAPLRVDATHVSPTGGGAAAAPPIRGYLEVNGSDISGWIAAIGDPSPRPARIVLPNGEVTTLASNFRQDLLDNGINKGEHAFSITVPLDLHDGNEHLIRLLDAETGKEIASRRKRWSAKVRPYDNFDSFLANSLTQPIIVAPFTEPDKRVFATMEAIANGLNDIALALESPPLVSIIMPVYNRENFVGKAIESVLAQTYTNCELIVVDDGSEDDSVLVAESMDDARLSILKLGQNYGQTYARNIGVGAARGEIIAYLDSDNTWDRRYLGATVGAYAKNPHAEAIVSGRINYLGWDTVPSSVSFGHLNIGLLENRNYLDTNSISHKRSMFEEGPPFNDSLKRYPDYDLLLRLSGTGKLVSCPLILCNYYNQRANNTITGRKTHAEYLDRIHEMHEARVAERRLADAGRRLTRPVTAVIPSWEAHDDLKACLSSILSLDWFGMLEVVVVDNASSEEVRSYLQEISSKHEMVSVLQNDANYGFTYAVNQGIAASRQPDSDVLLLNNDAIVLPGAVQNLQKAASTLPDAGITVPRQILQPHTPTMRTHVPYATENRSVDANISAHHQNVARIGLFHDGGPVELRFAPFFATYIRREVIDILGPLDAEHGRHYRSDRVYCDLVRQVAGKKIYHVPKADVVHKLQRSTSTLRGRKNTAEFDIMFRRNQWTDEECEKLDYRRATWDT